MLWWIVLPFQITLLLAILFVAVVTLACPKSITSKTLAFFAASGIALVAFIPACSTVMRKLDKSRFGEFQYATAADINDYKLRYWMPSEATNIESNQRHEGNRSKFAIEQHDLELWHAEVWLATGYPIAPQPKKLRTPSGEFERHFQGLDWQTPEDLWCFDGPRDAAGAGPTTWYSPSQGVAFQSCSYW